MIYVGVDNGTSSNGIGVVSDSGKSWLFKTPIKKELSYTKVAKKISRIDFPKSTLIVLELNSIPYIYLDSKEWQHVLLPKDLKKDDLKKASLDIGKRLFPKLTFKGDADGILIAEYLRRKNNKKL